MSHHLLGNCQRYQEYFQRTLSQVINIVYCITMFQFYIANFAQKILVHWWQILDVSAQVAGSACSSFESFVQINVANLPIFATLQTECYNQAGVSEFDLIYCSPLYLRLIRTSDIIHHIVDSVRWYGYVLKKLPASLQLRKSKRSKEINKKPNNPPFNITLSKAETENKPKKRPKKIQTTSFHDRSISSSCSPACLP